MSEQLTESSEKLIPDFDAFHVAHSGYTNVIEHQGEEIVSLSRELDKAKKAKEKLIVDQKELVETWHKSLKDTPPLYSASYYLQPEDYKGSKIEDLQKLHDRGVILAKLGYLLVEQPQPVLLLSLQDASITYRRPQSRDNQINTRVLHAQIGLTSVVDPLYLTYEEDISPCDGTFMRKLQYLKLNLAPLTTIQSQTRREYRAYKPETSWIHNPFVQQRDTGTVSLLGGLGSGERPNFSSLITELGSSRLAGRNFYDVFIGKQIVANAVEKLVSDSQVLPSDERALGALVETTRSLLV